MSAGVKAGDKPGALAKLNAFPDYVNEAVTVCIAK